MPELLLDSVLVAAGLSLIVIALLDLVNTLVSTNTSAWRWWPSRTIARAAFVALRSFARRLPENSKFREPLLSALGPLLVVILLAMWVSLQITGFSLIWLSTDIAKVESFGDAWYFSGVVYFTVGFGEIVPAEGATRVVSLLEAFVGVINVALVIGYLPTMYGAYTERERILMTLDAGSSERITPSALLKAWAPDGDAKKLDAQFERWELWAAGVLETHSTLRLLVYFRSHDRQQNWVTALGLLCDAALQAQIINGATDGHAFWFLRRAESIFVEVTDGRNHADYAAMLEQQANPEAFDRLYNGLADHGFSLRPYEQAAAYMFEARATYAPAMEYLIDDLLCPRGFWALPSAITSWGSQFDLNSEVANVTDQRQE